MNFFVEKNIKIVKKRIIKNVKIYKLDWEASENWN